MEKLFNGAVASASGLPAFVLYFVIAGLLFAIAIWIYTKVTAHDEWALLRAGNIAAGWTTLGAFVGLALPIAKSVAQAASLIDLFIWAGIALIAQVLGYVIASRLIGGLPARITAGEAAAGMLSAGLSVAIGLINAAAMTD